jgi:alpha-N-arabinofuranosidase
MASGRATSGPPTLNPNWGGVIEPNTFGTHEFMDFVQQIGADAYISINVGSGTPAEAADWLEYLTTPQPTELAKQRAANGHPAPYPVALLGIGNESWGCGGSMTPDEYVNHLRVYARYARNYNTAQPMRRIAVGPDGGDTGYTEAVMKAWKNKTWAWDIEGISLHSYTVVKWPPAFKATGFGESDYATILKATLNMESLVSTHMRVMDHTIRRRRSRWWSTSGARGWRRRRAVPRDSSSSRTASATRWSRAQPEHLRAPRRSRARRQHRADGQRAAGHDLHATGEDGPRRRPTTCSTCTVPFQDAPLVPIELAAGTYKSGEIELPRVDCHRGA